MIDFIDLAKARYSVRKFSSKAIENKKLTLILKAGQLAPTAANFQPQRILVINNQIALSKLKECTPFHYNAPAALLICYDKTVSWKRPFDGKDSGDIDASIVVTQMMLQAAEIGLGTTWVMHFEPEKIKEAYHIPENFEPVALLVLGYPADDATPSNMHDLRNDIEKMVTYNEYAAPMNHARNDFGEPR